MGKVRKVSKMTSTLASSFFEVDRNIGRAGMKRIQEPRGGKKEEG